MIVKAALEKLGLHSATIELGQVVIDETISSHQREKLKSSLQKSGLELIDDKKVQLIEKIKGVMIEMVHYDDELPKINFSSHISQKLGYD